MASPQRGPALSRQRPFRWILVLIAVLLILGFLLIPRHDHREEHASRSGDHDHSRHAHKSMRGQQKPTRKNFAARAQRPGEPPGPYRYMYDRSPNGNAFLISKEVSERYLPNSDAPAGQDLWYQDLNGNERLIAREVYRARFSPDGTKLAYTTSSGELHIQDLNGQSIAKIDRASDVQWHPDSKAVAYSAIPADKPIDVPEVLSLAVYDLNTGQTRHLTDGTWDDVRGQFHPSGNWLLFVSGGRSGLASFWAVPADGGEARQVTNWQLQQINDLFVPTPYDRTLWSSDGRWFIYDFKKGDLEQTWGLEFDTNGRFVRAHRFGEGLDPRWNADGTISCVKHTEDAAEVVNYPFPPTTTH